MGDRCEPPEEGSPLHSYLGAGAGAVAGFSSVSPKATSDALFPMPVEITTN